MPDKSTPLSLLSAGVSSAHLRDLAPGSLHTPAKPILTANMAHNFRGQDAEEPSSMPGW